VVTVAEAQVSVRDTAGGVSTCALAVVDAGTLAAGRPWRVFRWRQGQAHYSGWYWCATTGGHVVYESRLELARLMLADFDRRVVAIAAQPFLVTADHGNRRRRHVPDFLLIDVDGLVTVVNVKPSEQLADPKVAEALKWAAALFNGRGWRHEIWSGACVTLLANVRFLAGYRRADRVDPDAVTAISSTLAGRTSVGEAESVLSHRFPVEVCRPALLHLVWSGVLRAELDEPLSAATALERVA
jgi:TnsA endonuclease-like protein